MNMPLVQIQAFSRNLQPVHVPEHSRRERSVLEEIYSHALYIARGHLLDTLERLVQPELTIEVDFLPRKVRHLSLIHI